MNAKLACQVEEVLLLVAHHDGDVRDAGFLELANLTLDEYFATNTEETLGLLIGDRGKARGEASGHDDGIAYLVGFEGLEAVDGKHAVLDKPGIHGIVQDSVHGPKREARGTAQLALGHAGF